MDCEDHVVPLVKFLEPYDSNQNAASLTLHENDAVHVQLTSGTSSSNREEERPPEPITRFGSRAGTTNCDASGLGGFVCRYLSCNQESEDNIELLPLYHVDYLASHPVLCHCLVKQHSRNDKKKKKKKKMVRCQCTTKLTQVSSFSESHPSHGRARHQIRDLSESGRSRELLTPGTMTHASRAASSPEIFRPFLTVCLTVFPFEFQPRTFTIGFYEKKIFHIRAYDFGVQFSFKHITQVLHAHSRELAQHLSASPRARGKSRQKLVASHPDCAAGELQLHKRTVRMRVHGVRIDPLCALMHVLTQE